MLVEPNCSTRKCKHFIGAIGSGSGENTVGDIILVCPAFPGGIPDDIAYGKNKHKQVISDQTGDLVFETKK